MPKPKKVKPLKKVKMRFDGTKYAPEKKKYVRKKLPEPTKREIAIAKFKEKLAEMDKVLAHQGRLLSEQHLPPPASARESSKFICIVSAPVEASYDAEFMSGTPPMVAEDNAGWEHSLY